MSLNLSGSRLTFFKKVLKNWHFLLYSNSFFVLLPIFLKRNLNVHTTRPKFIKPGNLWFVWSKQKQENKAGLRTQILPEKSLTLAKRICDSRLDCFENFTISLSNNHYSIAVVSQNNWIFLIELNLFWGIATIADANLVGVTQ